MRGRFPGVNGHLRVCMEFILAPGSVCVNMEEGAICMSVCEGVGSPCESTCCI